jgi:hypothetical protein
MLQKPFKGRVLFRKICLAWSAAFLAIASVRIERLAAVSDLSESALTLKAMRTVVLKLDAAFSILQILPVSRAVVATTGSAGCGHGVGTT